MACMPQEGEDAASPSSCDVCGSSRGSSKRAISSIGALLVKEPALFERLWLEESDFDRSEEGGWGGGGLT